MSDIIIRNSRLKTVGYFLFALGVCAAGIWLIRTDDTPFFGWCLAITGGLGSLGFIWIFFDRKPQIIIGDTTIVMQRPLIGVIPLSEIASAHDVKRAQASTVDMVLRDPAGFAERHPAAALWVIDGKISFKADGYELEGKQIAEAIMLKLRERGMGREGE